MSRAVTTWYITSYHCEHTHKAVENDHAQQTHGAATLLTRRAAIRTCSLCRLTWNTAKVQNSQNQKAFEAVLFRQFDCCSSHCFVARCLQCVPTERTSRQRLVQCSRRSLEVLTLQPRAFGLEIKLGVHLVQSSLDFSTGSCSRS